MANDPIAFNAREKTVEWPTLLLTALIYGGWLAVTYFHQMMPVWLVSMLGAVLITWHSSLQHEMIHGHPTKWRPLNRALAFPPLSLWLPFELYRRSHLVHHRDERLTDPLDDPESYYWMPEHWAELGPLGRALVKLQTTFIGRLLIGPAWNIARFLKQELGKAFVSQGRNRTIWITHAIACGLILTWVTLVCQMSVWFYLFAIVYPGTSILLIRSFAEHRAREGVSERTAIVENAPFLGLLFLYNNLHAAHHEKPMMPWYEIPAWYKANRERILTENGGLVYNGYFDVARRFFWRPHDRPVHPFGRMPEGAL